jgi:hypothetical protein
VQEEDRTRDEEGSKKNFRRFSAKLFLKSGGSERFTSQHVWRVRYPTDNWHSQQFFVGPTERLRCVLATGEKKHWIFFSFFLAYTHFHLSLDADASKQRRKISYKKIIALDVCIFFFFIFLLLLLLFDLNRCKWKNFICRLENSKLAAPLRSGVVN